MCVCVCVVTDVAGLIDVCACVLWQSLVHVCGCVAGQCVCCTSNVPVMWTEPVCNCGDYSYPI